MASLTDIINNLIKQGKLPEGVTPTTLEESHWEIVTAAMQEAQQRSYEEGNSIGMREGLRPEEQARSDRENPYLEDPTRGSSENKG